MGHERVGILPRRKEWQRIVSDIRLALSGGSFETESLAADTLQQVRNRYQRLSQDSGVQAAFGFLVALSTSELPETNDSILVDIDLTKNPSPIRITGELSKWVDTHRGSQEYAELACRAAADTIAEWTGRNTRQQQLFGDAAHAENIWGNIDGSGFCDISRTFFSKLTERYLCYFIERSASAEAPSLDARMRFGKALAAHMDDISRHAFETSKITQSFAAGWFNKYATESRPTDAQLSGFLAKAFGKLQEELSREVQSR